MQRRRTTTACARCHNRKRKCDKKFPQCSSCRDAGVECKGLSRDANVDAPRSVVRYLEHAISQVEAHLASSGAFSAPGNSFEQVPIIAHPAEGSQSFHASSLPHSGLESASVIDKNSFKAASATAFMSGIGVPNKVLTDLDGIPYKDALLLDTELPSPLFVGQIKSNPLPHHLHGSEPSVPNMPEPLIPPLEMAKTLFEIYVQNILPQNPCFFEDDIRSHFSVMYLQPGTTPPEVSVFIISMILAISTMTSKAYDQKKILSLGESLHQQALRHSKFLSLSGIRPLQGILLLLQFAELLPYTGNLWHLAGEAVSMSTELGLHQDPHECEGFDFKSLDLRRRLFWTVYCLERSTTVTSYRPFTLKDTDIDVPFPSEYEDSSITSEGVMPGGRRSKIQFLNYVKFRQIQSQILNVQFFNGEMACQDHSEWVTGMEKRLVNWQRDALADVEKGPDWFSHALWQCYLMLHRPCPRNTSPSEQSIATCFQAALGLSSGSWELLKTGYLQYPFHNAHNGFEAATVVLYGLRYHTMGIRDQFGSRKVINLIHQLSDLFAFLSPRWPAAAAISDFYDNLKKSTIKDFLTVVSWAPGPQNLALKYPLDLIVLHKPVETPSNTEPERLMPAAEAYDESDLVLSNILGGDQLFNNQTIPEVSLWDDFWDFESTMLQPRFVNWLQMTTPGPTVEAAPKLSPVENFIEPSVPQETPTVMTSLPPTLEINFEALKNMAHLLPACNRCRTRRIKCERILLECQQCQGSDSTCVYFDQLLSKNISSRYVDALQKRLLGLLENQNQIALPADLLLRSPAPHIFPESRIFSGVSSRPISTTSVHSTESNRDKVQDQTYQNAIFFGATSAIAQLARLKSSPILLEKDIRFSTKSTSDSLKSLQKLTTQHRATLPPQATTMALLHIYNNSINLFLRIVSIEDLQQMCLGIYAGNDCTGDFELQTLHLILAVTLQFLSQRDRSLSDTAQAYFQEAASDSGRISSLLQRNSLDSLRVAILLCVYVLLRPKAGDIWRLVGFSSRLCLGMISTPRSSNTEKETYELLYQTLLCIDCKVSVAFGRPFQLPDYHDSLTTPPPVVKPMTFTEKLTSFYQNMRRIETRIHDAIIRKYIDRGERMREVSIIFHACGEQLDTWRRGWYALFEHVQPEDTVSNVSQIRLWGDLEYLKTLLLLQRMSLSTAVSAPDRLQSLQNFFQAYKELYYGNSALVSDFLSDMSAAFNLYLHPFSWVGAQAVFAAALDLVQLSENLSGGSCEPVFRSCITLLALLEGDSNNMLDGLTHIVEQLYDNLGDPSGFGLGREPSHQGG